MSAKPVKVRVLPGSVVYHGGVSYGEGQAFDLPGEQAKVLAEQGVVERA